MTTVLSIAPSEPGRRWRHGVGFPEMVSLPGGDFLMGEHPDDKFATDSERPRHRVTIRHPFAMGRFPVTVAQYVAWTGETCPPEMATLPAAGVSWEDAVAYCGWLADRTGQPCRLPSEAEWEYAGTSGAGHSFPNGDSMIPADANYLYDEQGNKVGPGRRSPVGTYAPNPFGLCDMAGNVCEWVMDAWHPSFAGAPCEGESWAGASSGLKVLRGGAWDYLPRLLRNTWRDCLHQATRRDNVGFRVACSMIHER